MFLENGSFPKEVELLKPLLMNSAGISLNSGMLAECSITGQLKVRTFIHTALGTDSCIHQRCRQLWAQSRHSGHAQLGVPVGSDSALPCAPALCFPTLFKDCLNRGIVL